jgi:hypothetical protein
MGLFKKIFKPVAKVLDKVIPNEIKPALPYLAAFAPVFAPAGMQGLIGSTMGRRALTSGLLNIGGQLAQEGSEGDINLLSAGLGALSGAMTTPGAAGNFRAMKAPTGDFDPARTMFQKAGDFGLEGLAKGSEFLRPDGAIPNLFSKEGLKIATAPAATATGDVMQASARQIDKQAAIDAVLAEAEALADSGIRGDAIRNAMLAYGFFSDEEIENTVASAGYKAGGRVGFKFGGIDKAIEGVSEEIQKDGQEGIMTAAKEDPLLVEEYNKYVFDLMEQRPDAKPMTFQDFKRMIMSGMKTGGRVKAEEGGLMDLGGKEMDLRGGGFVPIGKKEKADDVPARLSKNEFVMTADAVRAAGGGSVNEGAKRMYETMNKLEARA